VRSITSTKPVSQLDLFKKSVVLLDQLNQRREKKQPGRQEWITCLECVSASGVTLPPCLIFKGENLNSGWIPDETPGAWKSLPQRKAGLTTGLDSNG